LPPVLRKLNPLSDRVFVFLALELRPTGLTTRQAVSLWRDYEQNLGLRDNNYGFVHQPFDSRNSHEQAGLCDTLQREYGESWSAWNTDYIAGIEQIQTCFDVIDTNKPNPFRPQLFGRSRIIFVAPDNEYECAFNEREGLHFLTMSNSEAGFMTLRKQISAYHYPEEERGKHVKKMRPAKQFDDIVDTLRALGTTWGIPVRHRTEREEIEHRLPDNLKENEVAQYYGQEDFVELTLARRAEEQAIRIKDLNLK
jgi:hypothetical protein